MTNSGGFDANPTNTTVATFFDYEVWRTGYGVRSTDYTPWLQTRVLFVTKIQSPDRLAMIKFH